MKNKIIETQDGSHSIYSAKYGVSYHSKYGAIQESMHVFIKAGLEHFVQTHPEQKKLCLFEMGFGTGLNAFLTYLYCKEKNIQVEYTAVETQPVQMWQNLNYCAELKCNETDKLFFEQLHLANWNVSVALKEGFTLTKLEQNLEECQFESSFDVVYYDAFAPNAQEELWTPEIFAKMYQSMRSNGSTLTTYCAKGAVKRALKSVGFLIDSIAGPPGKREMTRANKTKD